MTAHEIAVKANTEWFAYQDILELETALNFLDETKPKVILEIGTAHGGSLAAWCEMVHPELAIALDPEDIPRTAEQKGAFDANAAKYNWQRIPLYTRNPDAHEALKKILNGRKVDFMFIDGAHGFDDVKHDYYSYKQYMSPNGVVGFHDITYTEGLVDAGSQVNWLWDRLKAVYLHSEIQHNTSMGIGFIYLGKPMPPSSHEL